MQAINKGSQSQPNSNESNSLGISNPDIERILQVKCKRHPKKNAEFLLIIPNVKNQRICHNCAREDEIPYKNYLEIREVLSEPNESNLFSILTPTDPQLRAQIQTLGDSIDSQKDLIDSFFKEIKNQIEMKLEERKQAQKMKLIQLGDIYQSSVICESKIIMDCKNLQSILLENDNEQKLSEFIRNHISNSQITTQKIKEACTQFQAIQNEFSMDKPNKIRNLVCQLLEQINFFEGAHPSPLLPIEQKGLEAWKSTNLLTSAQLILSNMGDSKKYSVGKNQKNELQFSLDTDCDTFGQAFLDFNLDPSANYVIQIKLEQTKGSSKCFFFGIVSDSKKDTTWVLLQNLCFSEQKGDYGINTLIKGQSILTNDNSLVSRSLEVRINIERKILRVGQLPNYNSVVQADQPERINQATPYRFLFQGLNKGSKMTITKLKTVSQFDSNM